MSYVEMADLADLLGDVSINSDGTYTDSVTGDQLQNLGSGLFMDPTSGVIEDTSGNVQVTAADVTTAGASLTIALSALNNVSNDVTNGNLTAAKSDLGSAASYVAQIPTSAPSAVLAAHAALAMQQASVNQLAGAAPGVQQALLNSTTGAQSSLQTLNTPLPVAPGTFTSMVNWLEQQATAGTLASALTLAQNGILPGIDPNTAAALQMLAGSVNAAQFAAAITGSPTAASIAATLTSIGVSTGQTFTGGNLGLCLSNPSIMNCLGPNSWACAFTAPWTPGCVSGNAMIGGALGGLVGLFYGGTVGGIIGLVGGGVVGGVVGSLLAPSAPKS